MAVDPTEPRHLPEILAPAGDDACLRAAVAAGADAVYFGLAGLRGATFNARARATNFDVGALKDTLAFLHDRGVRGYVTLNTLVFDGELGALEEAVRACAASAVDAVIVQDMGVAHLVKAVAPALAIHASTQMTCTDAGSVSFAKSLGASRVILARELSVEDIATIHAATDVELEVFVHGALCIAYSGQCLTSEAIGGRSANRGACAQACRLPYELVVDGVLRDMGNAAYLLSPEDLEASSLVPALARAGVTSLKIEGRLKGPEYVAAVTRLYRRAVDALAGGQGPTAEERRMALQAFSRGSGTGFLGGVDHQRLVEGRTCDHRGTVVGLWDQTAPRGRGRRQELAIHLEADLARGDGILVEGGFAGEGEVGGRVWTLRVAGVDVEKAPAGSTAVVWLGPEGPALPEAEGGRRRVFKTSSPADERVVRSWVEQSKRRATIHMTLEGTLGEKPRLHGHVKDGRAGTITLDASLEEARSAPLSEADVREKLDRLGETPFALGSLEVRLPPGSRLPVSSLNRGRRDLVEALLAARPAAHATTTMTPDGLLAKALGPTMPRPPGGLFVLCRTLPQALAALEAGADGLYLDFLELTGTGTAFRELRSRSSVALGVAPPRIRKPGEEKIDRYLAALAPDMILVRGLGALHEGQGPTEGAARQGVLRIGDFSLNVANRLAAADVLGRGLHAFTPSFDLDADQLVHLADSPFGSFAEVVVHHPMPLFHMEHCLIAATLSSGGDHRTCGRPCDRHRVSLRDRAGMDHPVEADVGCRNTVFHAAAQSAASLVPRLQTGGVARFRVELVREEPADVERIVSTYKSLLAGHTEAAAAWRSLRAEGGYGVVRGSLRVLQG